MQVHLVVHYSFHNCHNISVIVCILSNVPDKLAGKYVRIATELRKMETT